MRTTNMLTRCCFVVVASILPVVVGCGPAGEFPVAATQGTVEAIDGEIIEVGRIKLTPIPDASKAKAGKPAFGDIKGGQFVLTTYGDGDGAVIGKHKVRLLEGYQPDQDDAGAGKKTKHNCEIAPEFQTVEIVAGENVLQLKAVPRKRSRRSDDDD